MTKNFEIDPSTVNNSLGALKLDSMGKTSNYESPTKAYQKILARPAQIGWHKGKEPTEYEIYQRISQIYDEDRQRAMDLLSDFYTLQGTKGSKYWNPYTQATNGAVYRIGQYGIDASNVDDAWYDKYNYLKGSYLNNGNTNAASKPTKKSSAQEWQAYEFNLISDARQDTQNARDEWTALQGELQYWATVPDRNYTDDEIVGKIDWKKYPTLVKMDETREKGEPMNLNAAVGYSKAAMYGTIWQARNGNPKNVSMEQAIINSAFGVGNKYQYNKELNEKLANSPYSVGSTLEAERNYFKRDSFDRQWCLDHRDEIYASGDATKIKMYENVADAVKFTEDANAARDLLYSEIDRLIDSYQTNPDGLIKRLYDDDRFKILTSMDETLDTKALKGQELIPTSGAIDYNRQDVENYIRTTAELKKNSKSLGELYNQTVGENAISIEKKADQTLKDAGPIIEAYGTEAEKMINKIGQSSRYQDAVNGLAQQMPDTYQVLSASDNAVSKLVLDDSLSNMKQINEYQEHQDNLDAAKQKIARVTVPETPEDFDTINELRNTIDMESKWLDSHEKDYKAAEANILRASNIRDDLDDLYASNGEDVSKTKINQMIDRAKEANQSLIWTPREKAPDWHDTHAYSTYEDNQVKEGRLDKQANPRWWSDKRIDQRIDEMAETRNVYFDWEEKLYDLPYSGVTTEEEAYDFIHGKGAYQKALAGADQSTKEDILAEGKAVLEYATSPDRRDYLEKDLKNHWVGDLGLERDDEELENLKSIQKYREDKSNFENEAANLEGSSDYITEDHYLWDDYYDWQARLSDLYNDTVNSAEEAYDYIHGEGAYQKALKNADGKIDEQYRKERIEGEAAALLEYSQTTSHDRQNELQNDLYSHWENDVNQYEYKLNEGLQDNPNRSQNEELDQSYFYANDEIEGWETWSGDVNVHYKNRESVRPEYFMTDTEKDTFNKFYNRKEYDKAQAYLDLIMPDLQERRAEYQDNTIREQAGQPGLAGFYMGLRALADYPIEALESVFNTIGVLANDERYKDLTSDENRLMRSNNVAKAARAQVWDNQFVDWFGEGARGVGSFMNGVTYSIAENAIALAIGGALGYAFGETIEGAKKITEVAVQCIMSSRAMGSTLYECLESGMEADRAVMIAVGSGIIEWLTEKYSVENLLSVDPQDILKEGGSSILRSIVTQGAVEGSEEIASDVLSDALDTVLRIVYNDEYKTEIEEKSAQYYQEALDKKPNMTEQEKEEAKREAMNRAMLEKVEQYGMSGLAGAISGVEMSGGRVVLSAAMNKVGETAYYADMKSNVRRGFESEGVAKADAKKAANQFVNNVKKANKLQEKQERLEAKKARKEGISQQQQEQEQEAVEPPDNSLTGRMAAMQEERKQIASEKAKDKSLLIEARTTNNLTQASANMSAVLQNNNNSHAATAAAQTILGDIADGDNYVAGGVISGLLDNAGNDMNGVKNDIIYAANVKGSISNQMLRSMANRIAQGERLNENDVKNLRARVNAEQTGALAKENSAAYQAAVRENRIENRKNEIIAQGVLKAKTAAQEKALETAKEKLDMAKQQLKDAQAQSVANANNLRAMTADIAKSMSKEEENAARASRYRARDKAISDATSAVRNAKQNVQQDQDAVDRAQKALDDASQAALTEIRQQATTEVDQEIIMEQQAAERQAQREAQQAAIDEQNRIQEIAQNNAHTVDVDEFIEKNYPNATEEQKVKIREAAKVVATDMRKAAALAGENATAAELLNRGKVIPALEKKYGIKIEFADTTEGGTTFYSNGYLDLRNNRIVIDETTSMKTLMNKILGHELFHIAEASETYEELASALLQMKYGADVTYKGVLDAMNGGDLTSEMAQNVLAKKSIYDQQLNSEHSYEEMLQELVADEMGELLNGNPELINRLAAEKPGVLQRIIDSIRSFLRKARGLDGDWRTDAEKLIDKFEAALKEAQSIPVDQRTTPEDRRYMLRDSNGNQVQTDQNTLQQNKARVHDMEPTLTITKEDYQDLLSGDFIENGLRYFNLHGNVATNPILGDVILDKYGLKHIAARKNVKPIKAMTIPAIKHVIENGDIVHVANEHNGNDTAIIAEKINMPDADPAGNYYVGVLVVQANGGTKNQHNKYSFHSAFAINENAAPSPNAIGWLADTAPVTVQDSVPISRILEEISGYNANSGQVKENISKPIAEDQSGELAVELPGNTVAAVLPETETDGRRYSLSSWTPEEIAKVKKNILKNGFTEHEADEWIGAVNSVAAVIAADADRLDFTPDRFQKFMKSNGDVYKYTLDASTLCAKRLLYQGTFNAIQKLLPNTPLYAGDLIELSNMMREMGYQTPCGICYVESQRRDTGKFTEEFIEKYAKEHPDGFIPTYADLTTSDGLYKLRDEHKEVYDAYIKANNARGSASTKPVQLRTDYRGDVRGLKASTIEYLKSIGGLRIQSFSDFETPHLMDMMQAVIDMASSKLTSQAYTKVPNFAWVFGDTGIKINLSLMGEGTGLDENGNLIFSSVEGMDFDEAMKLRDRYSKNVGTILVGMNDAHILAAMADPRIDYIIPFHRSGWSAENRAKMTSLANYDDYQDYQNERDIKTGKKADANIEPGYVVNEDGTTDGYWDYTKSGKENAETYLKLCAEKGLIPKFEKFLVDNGDGSYSLQPDGSTDGYWKLLIDFKMYDNDGVGAPQQAVTPNINMPEAYRVLNEFDGTGVKSLPVAQPVVDRYVEEYKAKNPGRKYSLPAMETIDQALEDMDYEEFADLADLDFADEEEAEEVITAAVKDIKDEFDPTIYNGRLYVKPETLDYWLSGKGFASSNPNYAQAYITTMNPADFLRMTTTREENQRVILNQATPLNDEQLSENALRQPIQLIIDEEDGKIIGHEGRHRSVALARAGVTEMPVLLFDSSTKYSKTPKTEMTLEGQNPQFDYSVTNGNTLTFRDVIPLNTGNRDEIVSRFTASAEDEANAAANNQRVLRYSLPSDTDYMVAVDRGDMDEAQRLVNDVADESGYTIPGYHGTSSQFNTFDINKAGVNWDGDSRFGPGFYFAHDRDTALQWTDGTRVVNARLSMRNPLDLRNTAPENIVQAINEWADNELETGYNSSFPATYEQFADNIERARNRYINNPASFLSHFKYGANGEMTDGIREFLSELGYDGIVTNDEMVVFTPEQIKNADPVTYDDNGNVIPLSERFNDQKEDIRYSLPSDNLLRSQIEAYLKNGGNFTGGVPQGPQRQFGNKTAQRSDELSDIAKNYLKGHSDYTPDTNQSQVERAVDWITSNRSEGDPDGYMASIQKVTAKRFASQTPDGQARTLATLAMAVAKGDVAAQVMIADAYNREGTTAGQTLQARKIFRLMTPEGRIATLRKMLTDEQSRMNAKGVNVNLSFSDWVYRAAAAATQDGEFEMVQKAAAAELAEQLPQNWKDRLRSVRMLSMLGNPRTHIRNILGNMFFVPAVGLKNKLGAAAEIISRQDERTKTLRAMLPADVRRFASNYADSIQSTLTGEAKYNEGNMVQREMKPWGNSILQKTIDLNSNLLEAEDWLFLKGHFRRALGGWMVANGYTVEQMQSNYDLLQKGVSYAIDEAQKATYRDASKIANIMNKVSRDGGIAGFLVDAAMPFKKTPANILKRGIEYSPVSLLRSFTTDMYHMKQYNDYMNGKLSEMPAKAISPTQWIDRFCSGLSGTVILGLGALLSHMGLVTVGLDDDDDKLKQLKGEQKYAIHLFGNDISFTMDWAAPMSMPFFVGASVEKMFDGEGDFSIDGLVDSLASISEPVFNLSMLDGVNSLFKTSQYDDTNQLTQIGAKVLSNYITSYVPSAFGAIARTIDPYSRKSYVESGKGTGVTGTFRYAFKQAQNKIPGANQLNIPVRDVWGRKETAGLAERILENFILPGYVSRVDDDPLIDEIGRVYEATEDASLIPSDPPKSFTYKKDKYVLTDKQWDSYKEARGQAAFDGMTKLIENADYQNADETVQAQMIKDVWSYADKVGRTEIIPDYDLGTVNPDPIGQIAKEAKVKGHENEMIKALNHNDYEAYNTMVQALYDDGVEDKDIREKIGNTYRDLWKDAFKRNDGQAMADIEEMLYKTGYDFNIYGKNGWAAQVDKQTNP